MRITRLQIENFRSIKQLDIELPQICALVGPNNSGKSNLLLAMQRVLGRDWVRVSSFSEDDICNRDPSLDMKIALSFAPPLQYAKFKGVAPVAISTLAFECKRYKIGSRKGERRLEQTCLSARGEAPMVPRSAPKKNVQARFEPLIGIPSEVRDQVPFIYIGTNRSLRDHLPGARYSLLRQLLEDVDRDLHTPDQTVKVQQVDGSEADEPRIDRFRSLMDQAMDILRTEDFARLEASIKRNALRQLGFDPDTEAEKLDFFFAPFDTMDFYKSLDLRVREGDFEISATELGEGIQNALVLAILQAFEERRKQGAILVIEEPEMFLHPQMQRSLAKTLTEVGATNQVIYTTHSPHFVSIPDYENVRLVRKGDAGTTVRRSDLPSDTARREKLRKELDPERNELFFASRLLLVEGDTEKLALPEYARRLGLDLDREGATIVEVGGKRNLPEFAKIATSFQIPTGVIYDRHSSDFQDNSKDDESVFNSELAKLARSDGSVRVWELCEKYEDHLRKAIGEQRYQQECQKYPSVSKPIRARLMAADAALAIPEPFGDVLHWLAAKAEPMGGKK